MQQNGAPPPPPPPRSIRLPEPHRERMAEDDDSSQEECFERANLRMWHAHALTRVMQKILRSLNPILDA